MDWTMLADALDIVIYLGCGLFLVYGAALSIASVLPESHVRRAPRPRVRSGPLPVRGA